MEGAVRALRRIGLRRKLEQVQRELASGSKEPARLEELLEEKMRIKRALMDRGLSEAERIAPAS